MHFGLFQSVVWSAGLISFCIRTAKAQSKSAATMPLASGLQALIPNDMGTAGVACAVWSSASIGRPKQRPRSSEARARVKRRAARWKAGAERARNEP